MVIMPISTPLSDVLAATLTDASSRFDDEEIVMLAIDCHPWDGTLALAILTADDVKDDPLLDDPEEMAAWPRFGFAAEIPAWREASALAKEMAARYAAAPDQRAVASEIFRETAGALSSAIAGGALRGYRLAPTFRVSVAHPDSGEEFFAPPPSA